MGKQNGKVLVVDDEVKITEVLQAYLENAGYQTEAVYNGKSAVSMAEKWKPDLIILDLMLPDLMGEVVCRIIHQKQDVPIIILTAKIEEEDMVRGLQIGADDYIVKPFSPRNVLARVETVLRRTQKADAEEKKRYLVIGDDYITVDFMYRKVEKQGMEIHLTPTKYKIFELLVKSPGRVYSREQIISYALEDEFDGFERSLDGYIKNIRRKLEPEGKEPRYFVTVYGVGYKFVQ